MTSAGPLPPARSAPPDARAAGPADGEAARIWALEAIERSTAGLLDPDTLRRHDLLTAAVYVAGAGRSLRIAARSLRQMEYAPRRPPTPEDALDPLLAEWLS